MTATIWTQTWEIMALGMSCVFIFLCLLIIGLKIIANWSESRDDDDARKKEAE